MAVGDGLLDFAGGAGSGADVGHKVSGGNPYVTGGAAVAGGLASLFGGASQRRMENRYNKQQLRLGEMDIATREREEKATRDAEKRRKQFGQMLGKYFQSKYAAQQPATQPAVI